jgi:hypothetical protein
MYFSPHLSIMFGGDGGRASMYKGDNHSTSLVGQWGRYVNSQLNALSLSLHHTADPYAGAYDFHEKYFSEGLRRMRSKYEAASMGMGKEDAEHYDRMIGDFSRMHQKISKSRNRILARSLAKRDAGMPRVHTEPFYTRLLGTLYAFLESE